MGILGSDVSNLQVFDFLLRLFVVPLNVAAIWIAVTSKQENTTYGKVEFKNVLVGLKYMVCIGAISAGYALSSALSSWLRLLATKAWLFFVTDQVLAYLMVTSMAAQGEFLYLAYKGDREVAWSQACGSYGRFCNRLQLALVLHVFAVGAFLVLAVISAYRVFRRFEPPFVPEADSHHHQLRT